MQGEKKNPKKAVRQELTALERLGLRVSAMINGQKAQLERRVMIPCLDTDDAEAWTAVQELLRETGGVTVAEVEGGVLVTWEPFEDGEAVPLEEMELPGEVVVQDLSEVAPF